MNSVLDCLLQRRAGLLIGLLLFMGTWVVYWPAGSYEFVSYDDPLYVPENGIVQRGLTWEGLKWAFSNFYVGHWHPLTWVSHMAVCEVFGTAPGAHHLVNVFLHGMNVVLFFLVLWRLTKVLACSAFAAALFAWHPLRVESVAWVAEQKDVLAGLFWLLTIWAYTRWVESPRAGRYGLLVVLFAMGLLSKAILITLPFVLLLLDFWPLRRVSGLPWLGVWAEQGGKSLWGLIREKAPLFGLVAVSCVTTFLAGQGAGAVATLPLMARVDNALVSYVRYVWKFLWPVDLAVLYPHPGWWPKWQVLGAVGVLIVMSALVVGMARRRPYLAVGCGSGILVCLCR